MAKSVASRVKTRRETLRRQGLRPVQIWVPDTRAPGFLEECRRQSKLVAGAERDGGEIAGFLDAALAELTASGEWT